MSKNREVYKSRLPPKYPLEKITIPVAIFHGLNDAIISVKVIVDSNKSLNYNDNFPSKFSHSN